MNKLEKSNFHKAIIKIFYQKKLCKNDKLEIYSKISDWIHKLKPSKFKGFCFFGIIGHILRTT